MSAIFGRTELNPVVELRAYEKLHLSNILSYPVPGLDTSLGLQEVEASRIFRHSAHEVGNVLSLKHQTPLPPRLPTPGENSGTHFC
jgi:hypothetical protein